MKVETKQPVIISGKRHEKGVELQIERVIAKKLIKENKVKSLETGENVWNDIKQVFTGQKKKSDKSE